MALDGGAVECPPHAADPFVPMSSPPPPPRPGNSHPLSAPELTRTVLSLLVLAGLILGTFWILRPFLPAFIWAVAIVIATWPLMLGLERRLWGRRGLAVTVMTTGLLLLFFVPLSLAIATVLDNVDTVSAWIKSASGWRLSEPPAWLQSIPVIGTRAAGAWREAAASGLAPLLSKVAPYAGSLAGGLLREASALGAMGLQFLMTVVLCALLYAGGESVATQVLRFVRRLAGQQGENTARLAAASVRGVALGVVVTAIVQSALGGLGLAVIGFPATALLTAVMFLLAVAQIGVGPVLVPVSIWLFWTGDTVWGIVMAVWMAFVGTLDNILRPWLIQRGADLPLLLVFAGVVGGLLAFGLVGIFIGPVVLAVTWTLAKAWLDDPHPSPPAQGD